MSQNAARTNNTDTPKAGMIAGPHTASQTAQPVYHVGSVLNQLRDEIEWMERNSGSGADDIIHQ